MSQPSNEDPLAPLEPLDPHVEPPEAALPHPTHTAHGKMPEDLDDDKLALAAERERVELGLADYVPDDVPPATDPLPEGSSEEADLAQRGLVEEIPVDEEG
jgi:hypothetical protein